MSTELADYTIMTCAPEFREHFNDVREQVTVCHCIVQTMKGKDAKDAEELSLESVMAAVSRAKAVTGYATVREAVLLNGAFILAQVPAMQAELGSALNLDKSTFISELRAEVCTVVLIIHCMLPCSSLWLQRSQALLCSHVFREE